MVRSPVDICFGTSPSQAPKSRPLENAAPLPIAATVALEMIGPMPGTVISRSHAGSPQPSAPIFVSQSLDEVQHAWRQDVCAFGKYAGQFDAHEARGLVSGARESARLSLLLRRALGSAGLSDALNSTLAQSGWVALASLRKGHKFP